MRTTTLPRDVETLEVVARRVLDAEADEDESARDVLVAAESGCETM